MKISKKITAALLSGCMALSAVPAMTSSTGYAAVTKKYDSAQVIWDTDQTLLFCPGESEPNNKFIKALLNATGKTDIVFITFGDLEKITALNLSNIGLEGIPRAIEYMTRLRTLDLSRNKLRSSGVSNVDFSNLVMLTSLDLSYNYLTSVPAWYTALNISNKKINYNLINTTSQRNITIEPTAYYFGVGDAMTQTDINRLKDKIISTLKLNDGSMLPHYFYDPDLNTYDIPEEYVNSDIYLKNENVEVDIPDLSKYISKDVVSKAGSAKGTVSLFVPGASTNPKIKAEFTIYFLDGNDPSTIKFRLESLIAECETLNADSYTEASWIVFTNQLKTAKAICAYSDNDKDMLSGAYESLLTAKKNLLAGVNSGTDKILGDLLSIAKTYKEAEYSAESWRKFSAAVAMLNDAKSNKSTSLDEANAAIKAFQEAQNGLKPTKQNTPLIIPKSDFESIYGENRSVTAKGATRDGYKYSWKFTGTDVTLPADFNPEVFYESKSEELIRFEVGNASDFQIISFAETKTFPGIGELTLDVSKVYSDGVYRLYKWDTKTKKSEFIREVTVEDGIVTTSFSEGGDYFISSVLKNFKMISSNFEIKNDKRTITANYKKKYTVADFRSNMENGEALIIKNADDSDVYETQYISTGMKAAAPGSDEFYTLVVIGDPDGDGNCTALDAVMILKAVIGDIKLETYEKKAACDLNGDGWVKADDAVEILRYIVGIE